LNARDHLRNQGKDAVSIHLSHLPSQMSANIPFGSRNSKRGQSRSDLESGHTKFDYAANMTEAEKSLVSLVACRLERIMTQFFCGLQGEVDKISIHVERSVVSSHNWLVH
jgi:hypothetical protein